VRKWSRAGKCKKGEKGEKKGERGKGKGTVAVTREQGTGNPPPFFGKGSEARDKGLFHV
jgi:hypothetical protein